MIYFVPTQLKAVIPASIQAAPHSQFYLLFSSSGSTSFSPTDLESLELKSATECEATEIDAATLKLTHTLLDGVAGEKYLREVSTRDDGSIEVVWDDDSRNYTYVNIGQEGVVHLYYSLENGLKWEGLMRAYSSGLASHLETALRFTRPAHIKIDHRVIFAA